MTTPYGLAETDRAIVGGPALVVVTDDEWRPPLVAFVQQTMGYPVRFSHYERAARRMLFVAQKETI